MQKNSKVDYEWLHIFLEFIIVRKTSVLWFSSNYILEMCFTLVNAPNLKLASEYLFYDKGDNLGECDA